MLDNDYQLPKPEAKEYDLIPDDAYEAIIKDVELIVSPFKDEKTGEERQVLKFTFGITEKEYSDRLVWKVVYPAAYISKEGPSMLLQIVNAVRKCDATKEEASNVSSETVNSLVGQRLRVTVGHKVSKAGNEYNVVTGFLPSKLSDAPQATLSPSEEEDVKVEDIPF